ncbi:MAG TPA: hypothetical protein VH417_17590 [Vicinamibacterales bacterium]|jgi:hypothetical protein
MRSERTTLGFVAVVVVATLSWSLAHLRLPEPVEAPGFNSPPTQVDLIARAIAVAEGYYARGDYRGRSLPYRLKNPGALKRTADDRDPLPRWRDTGLIVFSTHQAGWAALRRQICLMLTARSEIYQPTDTLDEVSIKYADGDTDWGVNVASALGLDPSATIADLAAAAAAECGR